jgi:hypothetical protein
MLPAITLNSQKFDGLQLERSQVLAPLEADRVLVLSDLKTLGCLPSVISFPEPAKRGKNSWKKGSFKGTADDLLEIDRISRMQQLHVVDIIRRENDLEKARLLMLNPTMGLPPDRLRKKKLKSDFVRQRSEAQLRLRCVLEDHAAFLEALHADHNREFYRHHRWKRKRAKASLSKIVLFAQTSLDAQSLSCAIEMCQLIFQRLMAEIQERYMVSTVRPAQHRAQVYLRNIAMSDHLQVHAKWRALLIKEGIVMHSCVFPRFLDEQLYLDISVQMLIETNQLSIKAFDPTENGCQQWVLNVPMPRAVTLFLDSNQVEKILPDNSVVYKTNLQATIQNYNIICSSLQELVQHLLLVRDRRDRRKLELRYDPTMNPTTVVSVSGEPLKKRVADFQERKKTTNNSNSSPSSPSSPKTDKRFRRRQEDLHRKSIFLYRQYEQESPGAFFCHDNMELDAFRERYFYIQDTNDVFVDRAGELFSIFCEYAVKDGATFDGPAGPRLGLAGFVSLLQDSGLLLASASPTPDENALVVVRTLFSNSILSGGTAYFIDFLEAIVRWTYHTRRQTSCTTFNYKEMENDMRQENGSWTGEIQLVVEILIATTEVETWPALHRRKWEDHALFLTTTCKDSQRWVDVPPETKKETIVKEITVKETVVTAAPSKTISTKKELVLFDKDLQIFSGNVSI